MYRLLAAGCVALLPLGFSGCGARTAEANLKEQIALMKDMMADPGQIRDFKDIDFEKMVKIAQKVEKLQEEFKKFPPAEQKAARE